MPDKELDFEEFQRLYGPIQALSPAQAADLFDRAPLTWWIAGGWSLEIDDARPRRFHEDLEVAVARTDVPALREWLRDYHLWDTHEGALRFLWADTELPEDHEQLWLRRDAYSPWLLDLVLTPVEDGTWLYKRDHRVTRPLADVVHAGSDGIPRQRPEVTLLYKARRLAAKDDADFAATLFALEQSDRAWLHDAIELTEPAGHPWLHALAAERT